MAYKWLTKVVILPSCYSVQLLQGITTKMTVRLKDDERQISTESASVSRVTILKPIFKFFRQLISYLENPYCIAGTLINIYRPSKSFDL